MRQSALLAAGRKIPCQEENFSPGKGIAYNGLNIYTDTNLIDCTFNYESGNTNFIDMEGTGKTLTITNCTATLDGATVAINEFVGGSKLSQNTVVIK